MDKIISGGKLKERNRFGVRGTNDALFLVQHMQGLNGNIASELSFTRSSLSTTITKARLKDEGTILQVMSC